MTFHDQGRLFQVRRQPPCSDGFACPGSHHSSLADRTGATITGVLAKFQNCSSKLCLFFGPFEPGSLHQKRLRKDYNFGTANSFHELRIVNRDCAVQKGEAAKLWVATSFSNGIQVCVGEDLAIGIADLTFHCLWRLFQVRLQPPCSDGFACLGSHPSLANPTGATV